MENLIENYSELKKYLKNSRIQFNKDEGKVLSLNVTNYKITGFMQGKWMSSYMHSPHCSSLNT